MPKVAIQVEESVKYWDTIDVIQPESMSNGEFERVLEQAEKKTYQFGGGAKDLAYELQKRGIEIIAQSNSFPDSPQSHEIEIIDVRDIKEQK